MQQKPTAQSLKVYFKKYLYRNCLIIIAVILWIAQKSFSKL